MNTNPFVFQPKVNVEEEETNKQTGSVATLENIKLDEIQQSNSASSSFPPLPRPHHRAQRSDQSLKVFCE